MTGNYEETLKAVRNLAEHHLQRKPGKYYNECYRPAQPQLERRIVEWSAELKRIQHDEVEQERRYRQKRQERLNQKG